MKGFSYSTLYKPSVNEWGKGNTPFLGIADNKPVIQLWYSHIHLYMAGIDMYPWRPAGNLFIRWWMETRIIRLLALRAAKPFAMMEALRSLFPLPLFILPCLTNEFDWGWGKKKFNQRFKWNQLSSPFKRPQPEILKLNYPLLDIIWRNICCYIHS